MDGGVQVVPLVDAHLLTGVGQERAVLHCFAPRVTGSGVRCGCDPEQRNGDSDRKVECFTAADSSAEHATATLADNDANTGSTLTPTQQRVQTTITQCEAGWNAVPTDADAPAPTVDVPHPTACQLGDGRLAVLPNKNDESTASFCAGLELAVPSS